MAKGVIHPKVAALYPDLEKKIKEKKVMEQLLKQSGLEEHVFTPPATHEAYHYSSGKLGLDQLDWRVIAEDAQVMNYGEAKYDRDNWRNGTSYHEMFGSAMRHIMAFWLGETYDPESGLSHLSHARINLMFLRNWQLNEVGNDDRKDADPNQMDFIREDLEKAIAAGESYKS